MYVIAGPNSNYALLTDQALRPIDYAAAVNAKGVIGLRDEPAFEADDSEPWLGYLARNGFKPNKRYTARVDNPFEGGHAYVIQFDDRSFIDGLGEIYRLYGLNATDYVKYVHEGDADVTELI